jgi:hypothetical protein
MICWNLNGNARVFDHPVPLDSMANNYDMSDGACRVSVWREMNDTERLLCLMTIFHTMTVGDEVSPIVAHRALWVIPEYRAQISLDIRGHSDPAKNAPNAKSAPNAV